ncbi:lipoprotein [Saccharothrix sp. ST-888]|nr:lipoprotein [Saccharothrix sp. ST-888]
MRTARGAAILLAVGVVAALALATGGSGSPDRPTAADAAPPNPGATPSGGPSPSPSWDGKVKVLGDGSTSDTGPQPKQPKPEKLKPGEKPPQFVVFSWDGALENDDHLFSRFRELGEQNNAQMTFFLSGIYTVPNSKRALYHPPQHDVGSAAIDFPTEPHIKETLEQVRQAWLDGDEIGTHFNGHFCGAKGGGDWSTQEWQSELDQAVSFVTNWKTNTGFKDIPPLPFDYTKELVGGRAPCLEGQKTLLPAEKAAGWRYDASSPGELQVWPTKKDGIWNFPLQLLPYPNKPVQVLSMDFNFLANQSGDNTQGDPKKYAAWEKETRDGYLNGFERVYNGSRAPLFIGNHFETWNGGIYMQAIEDVMKSVCKRDGVRCVSFRQLADWLDVQDPKVLDKLRQLDPGQPADWSRLTK